MDVMSRWLRQIALATAIGLIAAFAPAVAAADPDSPPAAMAAPDGPAQAWLVADMISGRILAERDAYGQHAPASKMPVSYTHLTLPTTPYV